MTENAEVLDETQVNARAQMRIYLEDLVRKIVRKPNEAKVAFFSGERTTVYVASVNPEDLGLLLGKKGATIEAIRTLVKAMMARHNMRAIVQLDQQLESYCARGDKD